MNNAYMIHTAELLIYEQADNIENLNKTFSLRKS